MREMYPLTIILDRYGGTYSGGKYTAWNKYFHEIDERVDGDDVSCCEFFYKNKNYGKGETIEEAIADLENKIKFL